MSDLHPAAKPLVAMEAPLNDVIGFAITVFELGAREGEIDCRALYAIGKAAKQAANEVVSLSDAALRLARGEPCA